MSRSVLRAGTALLGFGGCAAVLHLLGNGALAPPPVGSWRAASSWYEQVGPAVATMAGVRVGAQLVALWLMVATLLQLSSASRAGRPLQRLADLLTPALLRQLVHGTAGLSLSVGVVLPTAGSLHAPGSDGSTAVMVPFDDAGDAADPVRSDASGASGAEDGTATMRPLDVPAQAEPATPVALDEPAPAAPPAAAPRSPVGDSYHVAPGAHLWAIAEEVLGDALGRQPTEEETRRYWLRLIEGNRSRLVVPANPDLIYPGQVLALPPV